MVLYKCAYYYYYYYSKYIRKVWHFRVADLSKTTDLADNNGMFCHCGAADLTKTCTGLTASCGLACRLSSNECVRNMHKSSGQADCRKSKPTELSHCTDSTNQQITEFSASDSVPLLNVRVRYKCIYNNNNTYTWSMPGSCITICQKSSRRHTVKNLFYIKFPYITQREATTLGPV